MKNTVKQPVGVTCRHCGTSGLEWRQQKNGKWRLYAPGRKFPHACRQYEPVEEREDEDEWDE